jgi:hypothetical protein
VFLPPIQATDDGPRRVPLRSGVTLPNGTFQPFIHFMFDQASAEVERAAHPAQRP